MTRLTSSIATISRHHACLSTTSHIPKIFHVQFLSNLYHPSLILSLLLPAWICLHGQCQLPKLHFCFHAWPFVQKHLVKSDSINAPYVAHRLHLVAALTRQMALYFFLSFDQKDHSISTFHIICPQFRVQHMSCQAASLRIKQKFYK